MNQTRTIEPETHAIGLLFILIFVVLCGMAQGSELIDVAVDGEDSIQTNFLFSPSLAKAPKLETQSNFVLLTFDGATLSKKFEKKIDRESPHFLVQHLSVYSPYEGIVRAKFIMNGGAEDLAKRVKLSSTKGGFLVTIEPPVASTATLDLLKKDALPLGVKEGKFESKKIEAAFFPKVTMVLALIAFLGVIGFFLIRHFRQSPSIKGSRKFLIEQVSYSSLGPKMGVALFKVGQEFVLVGVTPHQITPLSTVPKLQKTYEEESEFERKSFSEAVRSEMSRMKSGSA